MVVAALVVVGLVTTEVVKGFVVVVVVVFGDVPFNVLKMAVETGLTPVAQVLRKSSILMSQSMTPPNPFDRAYLLLTAAIAVSS